MMKRSLAILLTLALLCALVPTVFAAPTPSSTINLSADLCYTLTGLKFNSVLQNYYVDTDYIYITQNGGSGTVYLSRLKISGTTAAYQDHMTLTNCDNGETLAGYHYNGKLYFYVGSKGLEASSYHSIQIARIQYEAGASYTYTDLNRFIHLSLSTADGSDLGTSARVGCAANDLFTIFRIQNSESSVTYSCYRTADLNQALDASKTVAMESSGVLAAFMYSFTQAKDDRVLPNNSFQGMELPNADMILVCGGNSGETPAIAKMNHKGEYQTLAYITNIGTVSTGPIALGDDCIYIASVPDNTSNTSAYLNEQKIHSVSRASMDIPVTSALDASVGYTLSGLAFSTTIQNFYIDTDYIYIMQGDGAGTQYLSRLKINGTTATYVDHMTLTESGNGESLAGYHYNGKLYFFVGAKGLVDTEYRSVQIARIQYEAGKTYAYTDLNRFCHLSSSTADGVALGSSVRVACAADDDYTVMRIELSDGVTFYTCYDTMALNKALDSATLVGMENTNVLSAFVYHFKQEKIHRVHPNYSFQGIELANLNALLISGGNSGEIPAIAKMDKTGAYQLLTYITNVGTDATGPMELIDDRLYFTANSNATIYYVEKSQLGIVDKTEAYTMDPAGVLEAASVVKANMDGGALPAAVNIGGMTCTNEQFLDLACKLLINIAEGTPTEELRFSDVASPASPGGTATGTVKKEDYIAMARNICAAIESTSCAPNYTSSSSIGKMQHSYCVYMYAFLLDYYARYQMLPETYASMTWNGTTGISVAPSVPGVSALDAASATTIHQLPCMTPDTDTGDYKQNLSLIIHTGEGKIIVIDGGRKSYDSDYLFQYLQRITGDDTPHVDAWFLTHAHSDHYGALISIANNYASRITVDAFYHRIPTDAQINTYFADDEPATLITNINAIYTAIGKFKNSEGGAVEFVTLNAIHSGKCNSSFDFDDLHIDILLTIDDIFWAVDNISTKYTATWETHNADHTSQTPAQLVSSNFNNSSTVFRLTVGGKTILITGDASTVSTIMLERYHKAHASDSSEYYSLKTDIVQMAHHGSRRGLSQAVYNLIDPDAVLWPVPYAVAIDEKTLYPRNWIAALGATTYYSYEGPQALTFGVKRSEAAVSIPAELKDLVFDAEYYADSYPELKAAYGTDETQLYDHFINYGIEEGRCASPYFDVRFYMNNNGESLREYCHGDYTVAFAHFLQYVYDTSEKQNSPKIFSPIFDCAYYGEAYADLSAMTTEFQLLQHFATIGEAEGRLASEGFLAADGTTYHRCATRVVTAGTCASAGSICYTCTDCGYTRTETTETTGHTVVTDEAVAATCTATGLTEGSHCSVCNTVITAQTVIPATGHSYTSEVTTSATCSAAGVKTYTCSNCSYSYTETISATGHTAVTDAAVAATCTATGLTEGSHCSVCNAILVAQETVAATGHTAVTDAAVAATCTATGLTEGSHCSVCNAVLVAQETTPRLGHAYGYTDNGDGTHTETCTRCDKTLTESHEFTDGTCLCGAVELTTDESIKIYHALNLASDISISFVVPQTALADYDSYYMEAVLPEYEGNEQIGTSSVEIQPVVNGNYYYFTLTGITAVRMGDLVEATLHMAKGTAQYVSNADTYSVATYAYAMLNSTSDTYMQTLCADLLRYGAEAQSYKGYRTDALVDADMTETHRSYLSDTSTLTYTATDSNLGDLDNPTVTWLGKTLDLGSKVGMKFVFNTANYTGDISALSMVVSYTGSSGEAKTVTLTGAEAYGTSGSYYSFTFYGLLASELRTVVDVVICEGETRLSETLRYSAESYASKNTTGTLAPLCNALFAYSDSAKAYFAK